MAQISVVRVPRRRLAGVPHRLRDLEEREFLALGVLLGGLGTAAVLFLYASGREREAAIAGIGAAITGAFIGASKVLSGE